MMLEAHALYCLLTNVYEVKIREWSLSEEV